MKTYLDLLSYIMETGKDRTDRTGVGTRAVLRAEARREAKDIRDTLRAALAGDRKASVAMYEYMTGTPYEEAAK